MLGAYARDVHATVGGGGGESVAPGPRIGIFGGTFDPVHVGHLVAATWAREALDLERVLLVVANVPWQKAGTRAVTPVEACRMEIDRGGPSYTADTVRELRVATPTARPFVIVGADVAAELATWKQGEEVRKAGTLVV